MRTRFVWAVSAVALAGAADVRGQGAPVAVSAPVVAWRLAYGDSALGRQRHASADSVVFLAPTELLTDADLVSVQPSGGRSRPLLLRLRCNAQADQRVRRVLRDQIGRHLAVLVHGQIATVAVIASATGCQDSVLVGTPFTGADADRVRSAVRSKWPR